MSEGKEKSELKPKLDTGIKSRKNIKVKKQPSDEAGKPSLVRSHEENTESNSVMKVKITTKPKLDKGSHNQKTRDAPSSDKSAVPTAAKKITIADLCEEEKAKVYNIIEQLVTLTNDHEAVMAQLTREKEQYDAELSALNNSFSTHLLPIEEAMKRKDEAIISLETKNHMILAMLALYQAKIQNMSDINQFYVTNEADLQTRITLFKNEVDHLKGLNSALQQRIDNMETMAAANVAVVTATAQKVEQHSKHLEATLETERKVSAEAQSRSISLQNQVHQMQIELENVRSELSGAVRAKTAAENLAAKWKSIAETVNAGGSSGSSGGGAVLKNPYRRQLTAASAAAAAAATDGNSTGGAGAFISDNESATKPAGNITSSSATDTAIAVDTANTNYAHTGNSSDISSSGGGAVAVKLSDSEPQPVVRTRVKKVSRRASTGSSDVLSGSVTSLLHSRDENLHQQQQQQWQSSVESLPKPPSVSGNIVVTTDAATAAASKGVVKKKKAVASRVVSSRASLSGGAGVVPPVIPFDYTSGQPQKSSISNSNTTAATTTVGAIFERNNRAASAATTTTSSKSVVVVMPNTAGAAAKRNSTLAGAAGAAGAAATTTNRGGGVDYDLKLFDVLGQI